jgi:hypothetical protein
MSINTTLIDSPRCVVPSGLDLREIPPGTPVPGSRLSRPRSGLIRSGDSRFFSTPLKPVFVGLVNLRTVFRYD